MNRKMLLATAALVAVAVLAWDLLRDPSGAPGAAPAPASAPAARAGAAPASAASLGPLGPGAPPMSANFLRPAVAKGALNSPLEREFANATQYKALYERLSSTPEGQTPEGQYYLYRILRACATVADRKGWAPNRTQQAAQVEERRQQVAADLPEGDARRAQRLAAFEKINVDQCEGMGGLAVNEADLAQMLRSAVAGGDPKARAFQVEQEMWQERRSVGGGRTGPSLGETQLESLRAALGSKDPEAMVIAGRVLANNFRDVSVRIGPEQEAIENRAFMNAAMLLACEYGYPCGENNNRVLSACAYQGHCGVSSLADYMFYYGASPYDAQVLDRYRTLLRQAVDSGDWSSLTFQRGARLGGPVTPLVPPTR